MDYLFVYTTVPSQEVGKHIARTVISEQLAACANMSGAIQSYFPWKGKVKESTEYICIFKTTAACYQALEERIIKLHPYDTACVVGLTIQEGYTPFLQWITDSVTP